MRVRHCTSLAQVPIPGERDTMSQSRILIVHHDPSVRMLLNSMLQTLNLRVEEAGTDRAAVRMLEQQSFDAMLAWADPKDPDALELVIYCRRKHPAVPIVLLYPVLQADRVKEALQWGAVSVLRFPSPANYLRAAVAQALGWTEVASPSDGGAPRDGQNGKDSHHQLEAPRLTNGRPAGGNRTSNGGSSHLAASSAHTTSAPIRPTPLLGDAPNLVQTLEIAGSIASSRAHVLILGEHGTGKSLLARWIHQQSVRRDSSFLEVDCSASSESELEVELFGRAESAAGTPARRGKLSLAQGGTIVLDHICSISPAIQERLLRLIETGDIEPLGAGAPERIDVRLIFTCREHLAAAVERDQFRQDLYYRISMATLKLPPLRLRAGDIALLADHFRDRFSREIGRNVIGFTPEALEVLRSHSWPSNVLELQYVIERAVILCRGSRIESRHLEIEKTDSGRRSNGSPRRGGRPAPTIMPLKEALEEPERQLILQALEALNWNRQETARMLDINRTTLYKKMKKYGLLFDEPVWAN